MGGNYRVKLLDFAGTFLIVRELTYVKSNLTFGLIVVMPFPKASEYQG